ncbi:hypothetical protein KBD20_00040 [Candidatus Saccharibacteria bacterium]|nr:hypothetical protein [Candidatus Saccharibacteria bacterium]
MDPLQTAQSTNEPTAPVEAPVVNVKQQIVEKVTGSKNILVTVGGTPTVDELSAALALTFLLGKLQKHVTAVFSGKTPPAIEFLDPEKTFERTVDSLRDFIIALDKEKADKLRYKVEDDVVKVFITPYRTVISEKDLQFSQGDFNVDIIIGLGITKKEDLDKAIVAHGRILHDAEVITINANGKVSNLGSIDWSDSAASSVSEMLVSISESFGSGLLDEQISTALLTGIVAETNRFSNEKTSPKVMTMAAQLMAAGANQQLIATNLRQEGMISESVRTKDTSKDSAKPDDNGEMVLDHGGNTKKPIQPPKKQNNSQPNTVKKPDLVPPQPTEKTAVTPPVSIPAPLVNTPEAPTEPPAPPLIKSEPSPVRIDDRNMLDTSASVVPEIINEADKDVAEKPAFGGTLNATTSRAEEDQEAQTALEKAENNTMLEHGSGGSQSEDAIAAARRALEDVNEAAPFDPSNNPTESIGANPLPPVREEAQLPQLQAIPSPEQVINPDAAAGEMQAQAVVQNNSVASAAAEPSPVDAFMQPHAEAPSTPNQPNVPFTPPGAPMPDMPPLPPLPSMAGGPGAPSMPPLPPMPGQPTDPTAGFQPDLGPAFMQGVPQSQNSWTQAGDDMAAKNAEKEATRQAKLDQMGAQYDAAVDKNLEMQGKPPVNTDHSTFPLPPTQ